MLILSIPEFIITGFIICLSFYCLMKGIEILSKCINQLFKCNLELKKSASRCCANKL